jgi:hypothetical protein
MSDGRHIDLDDVFRCPTGAVRCESCGTEAPDLAVCTVRFGALGVGCLALCRRCATSGVTPPVTVPTAIRLVGQHCAHLGITADEAAELREE